MQLICAFNNTMHLMGSIYLFLEISSVLCVLPLKVISYSYIPENLQNIRLYRFGLE